jgi:hypothetical protein
VDGWNSYYLSDDAGLEAANYEFQLYIGTTLVQKASFTIQKAAAAAPTAVPQAASFGKITIAQDVTDSGETIGAANSFPAGTTEVWAYWTYINMKSGQSWGRKWLRDGTVLVDKSEAWSSGATGWEAYSFSDPAGLTAGAYQFVLTLGGKEVQRSQFTVTKAATPTPLVLRPALVPTLSNPHYERWGKPTNPDGCNDPNNMNVVRRFTMQLVVTNNTGQTVSGDWGPHFYSNTGVELSRCYYDYAGVATIPPGQTRNPTFVSFTNTETSDWVARVVFSALGGTWAWTLDRDGRILTVP